MSAHTPGPWHVTDNFGDGKRLHMVWAQGELLARTCSESASDANARVLAAAPELLEALKAMLEELEGAELALDQEFRCAGDPPRQPSAAVVAAEAAIAKAEGEQS